MYLEHLPATLLDLSSSCRREATHDTPMHQQIQPGGARSRRGSVVGDCSGVLSVKKVMAGRGAVDYYLAQRSSGLAEYYLGDAPAERSAASGRAAVPTAPESSWWGGGADRLGLAGGVEGEVFVPLFCEGRRPDGPRLGRRLVTTDEAAERRAAAIAAAEGLDDPYERWMRVHELRRSDGRASVAAWDCTFSPVKSVSLLWASGDARVQQQVWAAHLAAVDAGLAYLEDHAGYVRAGRNGVRTLETSGLVVARMNEWSSRDGDMQLHTHCLILNRAETREDERWRALDGRTLLTARTGGGAIYNRTLEAELTRRLQVAWRDRPDGLRELDGIDDELIDTFSSRRRAITRELEVLTDAYEAKHGHPPPPAVVAAMAQDATLTTRRPKQNLGGQDALAAWERTARARGRDLRDLPKQVTGRTRQHRPAGEPNLGRVTQRLAGSGRATFTRHDVLRAALDTLDPGASSATEVRMAAEQLTDRVLADPAVLQVSAPDVLDAPAELRRSDGSSVYDPPSRARWALRATLNAESWLLQVATEASPVTVEPGAVDLAVARHQLGADQAVAVSQLLEQQRRIGALVGPAGAGKTRTLRAVVDAWQHTGREVIGLTVSQAAAEILAGEAGVRAENVAKWRYEARWRRWRLPPGALVVVDEASMLATDDLVELVDQTRKAGGRILLVGDPAQLSAVHSGGAFELLVDRHGAAHLSELRRFTHRWEADASLALRRRDPAALAAYAMRGRVHGGPTEQLEERLFDAWAADAIGDGDVSRRSVAMIVSTNEQAAILGERARRTLQAAGLVARGPSVRLRDNEASVGDHIVTRRNDRRLIDANGRWVVNGDVWTITEIHDRDGVTARRHSDQAVVRIPAGYLTEHTHLGYATTAHRAQGMTVDIAHALIDRSTGHEQLYVAATRGRHDNHLWAITDPDPNLIADRAEAPTPEQVLTHAMQRTDPDRLAVHQVLEDSQREVTSLARLGAVYDDCARTATSTWLDRHLTDRGITGARADRHWPALIDRVRQLALTGHDLPRTIDAALELRPLGDAASPVAVLHWRLQTLADPTTHTTRRVGPAAALPPGPGPSSQLARQAAVLMRQRWRQIRAELSSGPTPSWAGVLGPRPDDPLEQSSWLSAATAVAAYRERYEIPPYQPLLGPQSAEVRPEAQAPYEHAQQAVDRHAARCLDHLTDQQLRDLARRQQAIIANPPDFDPAALERAYQHAARPRTDRDEPGRTAARIDLLEQRAENHHRWREASQGAAAVLRQIRHFEHRRVHPPVTATSSRSGDT
jgi:conjugative relaxase-like TrwC/TraI family protein